MRQGWKMDLMGAWGEILTETCKDESNIIADTWGGAWESRIKKMKTGDDEEGVKRRKGTL